MPNKCHTLCALHHNFHALLVSTSRLTLLELQGRFKAPLAFDAVLTGQHFPGPLQHVPAHLLINSIAKLCQHTNPSMQIGTIEQPSLMGPVAAAAQCIHVAKTGQEPPLDALTGEDLRLLGTAFQTPSGVATEVAFKFDANEARIDMRPV